MKTNYKILFCAFSILILNATGQTWQKTYSIGNADDNCEAICKTLDKCYLFVGAANDAAMIYKIDTLGNILWTKSYTNPTGWNIYNSIEQAPDSTLILGAVLQGGGPLLGKTLKLTSQGNPVFNLSSQTCEKAIRFGTTEYIAFGGNSISKISNTGSVIWEKRYNNAQNLSIAQLSDGNLISVGYYYDGVCFNNNFSLIKLNTNGDTIWTKTGFGPNSILRSVQPIASGGFICTGTNGASFSVLKFDNNGNLIYFKDINYYIQISKIIDALDGGSYLAGTINGQGAGGDDFFLMKIDGLGNTLWSKTYGSVLNESLQDVIIGHNNKLILVGNTNGFSSYLNDIYVVLTDLSGNAPCNQTTCTIPVASNINASFFSQITINTQTTIITNTISVAAVVPLKNNICSSIGINEINPNIAGKSFYPNPCNQKCVTEFYEAVKSVNVINELGQTVHATININNTKVEISSENLPRGIYFVETISVSNMVSRQKLIVE